MSGMEMMFSSLIGMSPKQIKEAADKTMQLITAAATDMVEIKEKQLRIETKLDLLLDEKGSKANGRKQLSDNRDSVQL